MYTHIYICMYIYMYICIYVYMYSKDLAQCLHLIQPCQGQERPTALEPDAYCSADCTASIALRTIFATLIRDRACYSTTLAIAASYGCR